MGRRNWALRATLILLLGAFPAEADDPKEQPPKQAPQEVPAWRQEIQELQRQGEEASGRNDEAAAVALHRRALAVAREHAPNSADLADATLRLAVRLGPSAERLALEEESLAIHRRLSPGDDESVAKGADFVALTLAELGRAAEALSLHAESLAIYRRLYPGDHPEVARSLRNVASTLESAGRREESLARSTEALEMSRRLAQGDDPDLARSIGSLGYMLGEAGRPADALPLMKESLAMYRRLFPGDHEDVARSLVNLAYTLRTLSRSSDALPNVAEGAAMYRRLFPSGHPDVSWAIDNQVEILESLGKLVEAVPLREESLALERRLFPGDNGRVAAGIAQLGLAYSDVGRPSEAVPLLEEVLAMYRRLFPGDHPAVATSLNNLAQPLHVLGRYVDALRLFEEALSMARRLYPGDNAYVATMIHNRATMLGYLGRSAEALPLHEEALAMRRRLFPGDHPELAMSLGGIASTLHELGRTPESLPFEEESLAMFRRMFPGDHPEVAKSLGNYAGTLEALGQTEKAQEPLEQSIAMYQRLFPGPHPDVARSLGILAGFFDRTGRRAEGIRRREEALAMYRAMFPGDHPDVARSLGSLGVALVDDGNRASEAVPLLEEALAMSKRLFPGDHPSVATNLGNMAIVLLEQRGAEAAIPMLREAYEMCFRLGSTDRAAYGSQLGGCLYLAGRASEAISPLRTAIETVEILRSDARGLLSQDRSQFVEGLRGGTDPYHALLRCHLALGNTAEAFGTLERGRSRELLDALLRSQVDLEERARARAEGTGDAETTKRLAQVRVERQEAEQELVRRTTALQRAPGDLSRAELHALRVAESAARRDLLDAMARTQRLIRQVLPEAAPLAPTEIQALLGPEERLLAYTLSGSASFVFVVGPTSMEAVRLEKDGVALPLSDLAQAVDQFRAVLTARDPSTPREVADAGGRLFRLLVPERVWTSLRSATRVYLIPQEFLEDVPFEALVVEEKDDIPVYWADVGPPIAYEASASVLAWLRASRHDAVHASDLVAVADPVFGAASPSPSWPKGGLLVTEVRGGGQAERLGVRPGDVVLEYDGKPVTDMDSLRSGVRVAGEDRADIPLRIVRGTEPIPLQVASGMLGVTLSPESPEVAGPKLLASGQIAVARRRGDERGRGLVPLPGTRTEVEAIVHVFRERLGDDARLVFLLGKDASEGNLQRAADRPRFLHLATHGLVDETGTASFSALAMTMPTVPVPGDDGFLTLVDLFQRWQGRLTGTELVVLSACNTAQGQRRRFDSPYSLPWGFLCAGARSVVGSLWEVDDDSTAFLMARFYERLLEGGGRHALEALASARLATKAKYPHPRQWSAFVLTGAASD